jgi:endo-1,4-beta-xylanase
VKSIKLNAKKATLGYRAQITLTATVNPTDAKYKKVTWTSSNKKVATVSSKGKITAKKVKKKTTVTITAKVKDGKTAKCKVTVLPGASYKVTYKMAGGKNNGLNPTYLAKNQSLKLKDPTRKNYVFKGWYVNGKKVKTLNKKVTSNKKVTVKAKWEKVKTGAATIKSAKNTSTGTVTVKYAKVKGVAGYEIFCSTSKKFTKATTTSVTTKKTSTKLKNLTKGTTYYVRVKAYKEDSAGNKVYGKVSKTIKVNITK